ncbi:MAG: DUF4011 domain-containing protein, partial [Mycoplasmataceae bacterium]|nr:DUF4011 domain-containing protein [Mycoplasmataceae bacterium]
MSQNDNYLKNKIINLVSISTKDRVIFTKLNSSDIFNPLIFYNLKNINALFNDDKVAKLSNNNDWNKLEAKLMSLNNFKEFESFTNSKSIFVPKAKLNLLESSFAKYKVNILEYLKTKFEKLDKKLSNLDNMARVREVDAGDWCLYLARYFLVGPLSNNEIVKSPIFFKEVNINLSDASIKSKESELHINEKLIVYLIKQEKKSATLLKTWNEITNINDVINFLNTNFDFDLSLPNSQLDFINEDMPKTKSRSNGKLKIEDTYIFGFFQPKGGKLKQDLEYIIDIEADVFGDKDKTQILNPKEVILDENSKWIQISSLNLSQLFALNLSLRSNTIIHGPPGTGKSETISNIIANIMINNKTALMVSEKKAALDVLLDRLGPLKDFGMFFQDTKVTKDKVIFYNTVKRLSDVYNNFDCDNLNFQYSDTSFEYLIKEKQKLNEAFTIMNEIRSWNINDFNYNQYLEAKHEILNKKILEVIKVHKLNEISKSNFFSLKTLSLFLVNKNLLELDLSEKKLIAIKKSFVIFKNQIVELNKFWLKVSKYDLNTLSILEINRIGNTQENIKTLFQGNPNLQINFKEDIFKYEKMEEIYLEFTLICDKLGVSKEVLEKLFHENNVYKLQEALNKSGVLEKKHVIANWFFKNEIRTSGFEKIKMPNWKSILILINKINKSKTRMDDFYIYMRNRKLLSPINVFFLIKGFIFDKDLSLYIENNWLQFDSIIPVVTHDNAITFEMAQLANKVYAFEDKYDTPQNLQIIEKYKEINKEIYAKNDINWSKIIKEIYIKLVISWREKINNSLHKEDIMEIFRISNLKRFPKIKTLMKKYFLSLLEIFPIWISRPEDVADIIECKEKIFDYGIFDEASQMFLERAYPILY